MDEHIKCFIQLVAFYQINLLVCRLLFIKLSKWCLRINENAEFMWKLSFESTPNGLKARRYMVICDSWKLASVSFYNAKCLSSWKNGFVQLLSLQLGFISTPDNFSVQFFWRQFNDGQQLSILLNRIELFSMIHYVTRSAHQTSAGLRYSGALRHPMSCHGRVEKNRQFWIFLVSDFWKSISCSVNLSSSGSRSRLPHTPSALRRCSTLWFHLIWRDKRSLLLWHTAIFYASKVFLSIDRKTATFYVLTYLVVTSMHTKTLIEFTLKYQYHVNHAFNVWNSAFHLNVKCVRLCVNSKSYIYGADGIYFLSR